MASALKCVVVLSSKTADERKTLAAVRALAGAGVEATLASNSEDPGTRYSRHCKQFLHYEGEESCSDRLIASLEHCLERTAPNAVLPLCDYTTQAVVAHQKHLVSRTALCVPEAGPMTLASDKGRVIALAQQLGIGTPQTILIRDEAMLSSAAADLGFPCVLKMRRGAGGVGRSFPIDEQTLRENYARLSGTVDAVFDHTQPLLQEFIPGEVHDACVLFNRGEPRAVMTQRRLAMQPAEGGVGIHNETTDDPELREAATVLLRALNWHGPAQVEFKRDARDGSLRLMEVNPRFWGTLDLAIRAGVNFPLLAAEIAVQGDVTPVTRYRVGARHRWVFSYESPSKPAANLQVMALVDALVPRRGRYSDFWLTDPLPHLALLRGGKMGSE